MSLNFEHMTNMKWMKWECVWYTDGREGGIKRKGYSVFRMLRRCRSIGILLQRHRLGRLSGASSVFIKKTYADLLYMLLNSFVLNSFRSSLHTFLTQSLFLTSAQILHIVLWLSNSPLEHTHTQNSQSWSHITLIAPTHARSVTNIKFISYLISFSHSPY